MRKRTLLWAAMALTFASCMKINSNEPPQEPQDPRYLSGVSEKKPDGTILDVMEITYDFDHKVSKCVLFDWTEKPASVAGRMMRAATKAWTDDGTQTMSGFVYAPDKITCKLVITDPEDPEIVLDQVIVLDAQGRFSSMTLGEGQVKAAYDNGGYLVSLVSSENGVEQEEIRISYLDNAISQVDFIDRDPEMPQEKHYKFRGATVPNLGRIVHPEFMGDGIELFYALDIVGKIPSKLHQVSSWDGGEAVSKYSFDENGYISEIVCEKESEAGDTEVSTFRYSYVR